MANRSGYSAGKREREQAKREKREKKQQKRAAAAEERSAPPADPETETQAEPSAGEEIDDVAGAHGQRLIRLRAPHLLMKLI